MQLCSQVINLNGSWGGGVLKDSREFLNIHSQRIEMGTLGFYSFRAFIIHKRPICFVFFNRSKKLISFVFKIVIHFPFFVRFLIERSFSKIVLSVKNLLFLKSSKQSFSKKPPKFVLSVKNDSFFKIIRTIFNCSFFRSF